MSDKPTNDFKLIAPYVKPATHIVTVMEWAMAHEKPFTFVMAKAGLPLARHEIQKSLDRLVDKGFLRRRKMPMSRAVGRGTAIVKTYVYFPQPLLLAERDA